VTAPPDNAQQTPRRIEELIPASLAAAYAESFPLISERLALVEEEFSSWLASDVEIISRIGSYLSQGGGKRLRPALLLLAGGMVGYKGDHDVLFGAVFEAIHTATLIHDDIIDEADVRRGKTSLNRLLGNGISVLMGDHLYLKAMKMALRARNLGILDLLADVTIGMVEGELIQKQVNGRLDTTEEQSLDIVRRKTALLFSACCQVPAILAGRPEEERSAAAAYGLDLGMAFQVVDDLLDLTAEEKVLGKPVGGDLRNGKLTLPLVNLLRLGRAEHRDMVSRILNDGSFGAVRRDEILAALAESGALQMTRETARSYAERARSRIGIFPPNAYRRALLDVPGFVVSRDR